jgi:hypothetical protein
VLQLREQHCEAVVQVWPRARHTPASTGERQLPLSHQRLQHSVLAVQGRKFARQTVPTPHCPVVALQLRLQHSMLAAQAEPLGVQAPPSAGKNSQVPEVPQ